MDNIFLGQRLQNARISRNLTQEAVAELIDAAPTTISRWETGATFPSIRYQKRLCEVYRKEYRELFGDFSQSQLSNPSAVDIASSLASMPPGSPATTSNPLLVELQISIPVSIVSAKELIQQIQKNIRVNGKLMEQSTINIEEHKVSEGNITITARVYAPPPSLVISNSPANPVLRKSESEQPLYPFLLKKPDRK